MGCNYRQCCSLAKFSSNLSLERTSVSYACGMSSAGGPRLPAQQPCYFGYGVGRPRKDANNQCAAFQKKKKEKGWRADGLLRQQAVEICGRS
jgi:hypothetical protein